MKLPKLIKLDPKVEAQLPMEIQKLRQFYFKVLEKQLEVQGNDSGKLQP
jgi:hypothetical protein